VSSPTDNQGVAWLSRAEVAPRDAAPPHPLRPWHPRNPWWRLTRRCRCLLLGPNCPGLPARCTESAGGLRPARTARTGRRHRATPARSADEGGAGEGVPSEAASEDRRSGANRGPERRLSRRRATPAKKRSDAPQLTHLQAERRRGQLADGVGAPAQGETPRLSDSDGGTTCEPGECGEARTSTVPAAAAACTDSLVARLRAVKRPEQDLWLVLVKVMWWGLADLPLTLQRRRRCGVPSGRAASRPYPTYSAPGVRASGGGDGNFTYSGGRQRWSETPPEFVIGL